VVLEGKKKSQISEFLDYNGCPGVQHVAFYTSDIVASVAAMRDRGVQFLPIAPEYYQELRGKVDASTLDLPVDLGRLEELGILLDFNTEGYLLQIFTEVCGDLPTLFLEIVERNNFAGFGAGNFKALFQAVESGQRERGNLF
jgi:4-hydroxyphenylpyruvate dioxygenase